MSKTPKDNSPQQGSKQRLPWPSGRVDARLFGRQGSRVLRLTRLGLFCERLWQHLWPAATVLMAAVALLGLGAVETLAQEGAVLFWGLLAAVTLAFLAALVWGLRGLRLPDQSDAVARLDGLVPGAPFATLRDTQAVGSEDPASVAIWQAHRARMARQAEAARPPKPNLRISTRDPYALRYVALVAVVVASLFGSLWRAADLVDLAQGAGGAAPMGPTWEGWIEPPRYTGLPTLYLNDQPEGQLQLVEGSRITLRLYGAEGDLTLLNGLNADQAEATSVAPDQTVDVAQSGPLEVQGPGGRSWLVEMIADLPPRIVLDGNPELSADGTMSLPFEASDDYGVVAGRVEITLDLDAVDRRYGLRADPDPRPMLDLPLPLSLTGDRRQFSELFMEDFSEHPWANLPVRFRFLAEDAPAQLSPPADLSAPLAAQRFFDPVAAALAEQRRDLLWARSNGPRIAQVLRTMGHAPQDLFDSPGTYLQLRAIIGDLESSVATGLEPEAQERIAAALWDLARQFEDGDVGDALERMRQAQERLSQAMRDGASEEEIARLMQELREATQDYMRQLSRQAARDAEDLDPGEMPENSTTLSQDDLQAMMDRIQELMEQGRMAEAEQALREFQQMMENMRVTQGQGGQGNSPGQQAMQGLADTLRDQQGLSDEAFRDLQEQYNNGAQAGESQGNQGRNGGLGQGQSHEGGGQGQGEQPGEHPGEGPGEGQAEGGGGSQPGAPEGGALGDLAGRQQALRDRLQGQQNAMPLSGPEGEALDEALNRAGRAMEGAEQALRDGDFGEAIDQQSGAMEALRDGMQALGEAMADQQQNQPGGQQDGQQGRMGNALDPLGRSREGQFGDYLGRDMLRDGEAYRRAWDLLEELRRRAGERDRSDGERDYLKRLLDNF